MKELETVFEPIAKRKRLQTNINDDMYTIGFDEIVVPADFFRIEIAIADYFNKTVKPLPEDEHETASKAYVKSTPIQEGMNWGAGYRGVILEPNIPKGHKKHSETVNALENVIVAATSCIRRNQ